MVQYAVVQTISAIQAEHLQGKCLSVFCRHRKDTESNSVMVFHVVVGTISAILGVYAAYFDEVNTEPSVPHGNSV
jgi:hypothetical protein